MWRASSNDLECSVTVLERCHECILSMVLTSGVVGYPSFCFQTSYIYTHKSTIWNIPTLASRIQEIPLTWNFDPNTMKGSSYVADTHKFSSSLPFSNANHPLIPCQGRVPSNVTVPLLAKVRDMSFKFCHSWPNHASCLMQQRNDNGFVVGCASWDLVAELERELEAEMNPQEVEENARIGMARFRHKCGERKGVVELLECLEREAIMGEDVGKEPSDYNRRAHIFDKSSRVFQALKELNIDVLSQQSP